MRAFKETINGQSYSIEEAKQLFINYTRRHNGNVSERFKNTIVKIYPEHLPNGSRADANTDVKANKINMVAEKNSIVTFFHECKHISDAWMDSKGLWHTNWANEDDYCAQMSWSNQQNNEVNIIRGTKGLAMGEATAELYASKIFWELCRNSPQSKAYTANYRKTYDEEIILLKKICLVLGINEDVLLSWKSENNYGRKQLSDLFTKLTGRDDFWDQLEYRMDYVSMLKFINMSHPDYKVNPASLNNVKIFRKNVNELLETCLKRNIQERYYLSMGCSKSEFEQIYKKKVEKFKELDAYSLPIAPDAR